MKISIITPSFNSGKSIEQAINSVLAQNITDYEHIIVDGGSTDETLNILKRFPHIKWISEPDRGQVHAMKKGFAMATGKIIGYLNADDYYLEDVFSAIIPHFGNGAEMVMGKVLVRSEKADGITEWICDAKTDFPSVLRHWEPNAFCVNPVGYFYLREIQEKVPLQEESGAKHDLEFLMRTSLQFSVRKIDKIFGVFNHAMDTQTVREQLYPSYWRPENFPFVDQLAEHLSEEEQKQFRLARDKGYHLRRLWTVKEAFARGMAKELLEKGEVFMMPDDGNENSASRCGFVDFIYVASNTHWIINEFNLITRKIKEKEMEGKSIFLIQKLTEHIHSLHGVWENIHDSYPRNYQDITSESESLIKCLPLLANSNVIDIGCSSGMNTLLAGRYSHSVIGVDPSEQLIKRALLAKKYFDDHVYSVHNVKFLNGNFSDYINKLNVDAVLASLVLYHLEDSNIEILSNFLKATAKKILIQARPQRMEAFKSHPEWGVVSTTTLYNGLYKTEDCLNFIRDCGFVDASILYMDTYYHEYFPIIYAEK